MKHESKSMALDLLDNHINTHRTARTYCEGCGCDDCKRAADSLRDSQRALEAVRTELAAA